MARIEPVEFMTTNGILLTFRSAELAEAKAVLRLMQRSYEESPYLATRREEFNASPGRIKSWIESHLMGQGKLMIVAEHHNQLVGMIDFNSSNKQRLQHVGEFGLSVSTNWQRRGIGRALLQSLISWARSSAVIEKIELQVFSENLAAIQLYQSVGFREEGRRKFAVKYEDNQPQGSHSSTYMDLLLMSLFTRRLHY